MVCVLIEPSAESLEAQELALEDDCIRSGVARYREKVRRMTAADIPATVDPLSHLVAIGIEPLSQALIEWIIGCKTKPGVRATALRYLEEAPADVASLITIRTVLNCVYRAVTAQTVALRVARGLQDELVLTAFEEQKPFLYKKIQRYVEEHPKGYLLHYRRNVLNHSARKYGIAFELWSQKDALQIGLVMLDLMARSTGLVKLAHSRRKGRKNTRLMAYPTEALLEWVDQKHAQCEVLGPPRMMMVCPPAPFTNNGDGGYLRPLLRRPLVKAPVRNIDFAAMPIVTQAVNALMAVPYRLNERVLDVVMGLWNAGGEIPGDARKGDLPRDPEPPDRESPEWKAWKVHAREIYNANLTNKSKRIQASQTLSSASRLRGRALWSPYFLDFRGRVYASSQFLNTQGTDMAKSLLEFANGKPLGPRGPYWLAIHLANSFGVDKVSIDDRLQWVKENEKMVLAVAEDPYANHGWHEADSPCQFLAACYEWAGYRRNGEAHVCHLPVSVDGSCNGIQHLAALSRDAEAGALVNLIPSDKPSDIYQAVANETIRELEAIANGSSIFTPPKTGPTLDYPATARLWLGYGVDRDIAKRPTMILPYGGTQNAVQQYIEDAITKRVEADKPHPFGKDRGRASRFMAAVMWKAMGRVVKGPRTVMGWTREVAKACKAEGQPIVWRSPSGFRVEQSYKQKIGRLIKTRVGDQNYRLVLTEDTNKIDHRRQAQSLAPNWIHSLDAAALHRTIVNLKHRGVTDVIVVHDSFGTHPADMDSMAEALREEFVAIYSEDVVGGFLRDVGALLKDPSKLPSPPEMGSLNIQDIAGSRYAFA